MGLFDFFRRLLGGRTAARTAAEGSTGQPRCPHYTFAHAALRGLFYQDPLRCLGLLNGEESDAFLNKLWESVCKHCRQSGRDADCEPLGLAAHPARIQGYPTAVVELPVPRAVTEAYFVALVLTAEPEGAEPRKEDLRYVTLEKGFTLPGSPPRTVLAAWTADGSHSNYGTGPEPKLADFIEAVEGLLAR